MHFLIDITAPPESHKLTACGMKFQRQTRGQTTGDARYVSCAECKETPSYTSAITHVETLLRHVQYGDILHHTICGGSMRAHRYTRQTGAWLCGIATTDMMTAGISLFDDEEINDISPSNVTHVNFVPIENLDWYASLSDDLVTDDDQP